MKQIILNSKNQTCFNINGARSHLMYLGDTLVFGDESTIPTPQGFKFIGGTDDFYLYDTGRNTNTKTITIEGGGNGEVVVSSVSKYLFVSTTLPEGCYDVSDSVAYAQVVKLKDVPQGTYTISFTYTRASTTVNIDTVFKAYLVNNTDDSVQCVDYIRNNNANGRIELDDYVVKTDTSIQIGLEWIQNDGGQVLGEDNANDTSDYRLFRAGNYLYYDVQAGRISKSSFTQTISHLEIGNYYVKDLTTGSNLASSSSKYSSRTKPIHLFGATDQAKVKYIRVFENGILVKSFAPAKKDGRPGLYERVGNRFIQGSGDLAIPIT